MVCARAKNGILLALEFGEVFHEGSAVFEHAKGDTDDLVHDGSQSTHFGFAAFDEDIVTRAVSYTHLDVYKRQVIYICMMNFKTDAMKSSQELRVGLKLMEEMPYLGMKNSPMMFGMWNIVVF